MQGELNHKRAYRTLATFVACGAKHAVISPGSRSTPLTLAAQALDRAGELACIEIIDERVAAFVALGMSRITGVPTILIATSGSAAGHYLPALMEARASAIPLAVLSADRPASRRRSGAPQTVDQLGLFGQFAQPTLDLGAPRADDDDAWLATALSSAWRDALRGRTSIHVNQPFPRPVWAPCAEPGLARRPACVERAPASGDCGDTLAGCIAGRRAVIVAGPLDPGAHGGLRALGQLRTALLELAERASAPLLAEPASQLRTGHPSVVTTADACFRGEVPDELLPEVIVRVGANTTSRHVWRYLEAASAAGAETVLVAGGSPLADSLHTVDTVFDGDLVETVRRAAHCLPRVSEPARAWLRLWQRRESALRSHLDASAPGDLKALAAFVEAAPRESLLHVASSMAIRDLESCSATITAPVLANRGLNGIDGTIATALGECIAARRPTRVILGDTAFVHDLGGLAAAARWLPPLELSLEILVVNNAGGGIFEYLPVAKQIDRSLFERAFAVAPTIDISAVARACGAAAVQARSAADLDLEPLRPGELRVTELEVDRATSVAARHTLFASIGGGLEPIADVHETSNNQLDPHRKEPPCSPRNPSVDTPNGSTSETSPISSITRSHAELRS